MAYEDGWTVVRYGRGRDRQRNWNQQGRAPRGKDSAPPVSNRSRVQFPFPNRPGPPPGRPARYLGPQSRSYASVVKQTNFRPAPRFNTGAFRGQRMDQFRKQPADPKFGRQVRKMHSVIKMVHHLQNVTPKPGKPEPRMISRMVEILASMIKPAGPTADTVDLIVGNAKNWGYNTVTILENHYTEGLETILAELSKDLSSDWKTAFEVAARWARKNLPRITQDAIDHAEALITTCGEMEEDSNTQKSSVPQEEFPEPQGSQQTQGKVQKPAVATEILQQKSTGCTVATMTDQVSGWSPQSPDRGIQQKEIDFDFTQLESPKERRKQRGGQNSCVAFEHEICLDIEEMGKDAQPQVKAAQKTQSSWGSSLLDLDCEDGLDGTQALTPISKTTTPKPGVREEMQVRAQVHLRPTSHQKFWQEEQDDSGQFDQLLNQTSTPKPQLFKVKRHIITERKLVDWSLGVWKKWLIMGDSNLSRLPGYSIPDLQIESYPGANFRHAQAVLAKAIVHTTVEKVVLSFGINCRAQRAKETSVKQMQAAVRMAKKQFPYAEIWIPLINYSTSLSAAEQITLETLNNHITRNMPFLPALKNTEFQTEKDDLHWTKNTARAMLDHWISCLNLRTL